MKATTNEDGKVTMVCNMWEVAIIHSSLYFVRGGMGDNADESRMNMMLGVLDSIDAPTLNDINYVKDGEGNDKQ